MNTIQTPSAKTSEIAIFERLLRNRKGKIDRLAVRGREVRTGDRVRLRPLGRADIMDLALDGKIATVAEIEQSYEGQLFLAVTVDDDPGRDFGANRQPGHRFFFRPEEIEFTEDA